MVEGSAPVADTGMSSKRFKLIMRYKKQDKELKKIEAELVKLAKNLALTSDCLNEAREKEEFYKKETEVLTRKAAKARV